jgi:hypothetical protein
LVSPALWYALTELIGALLNRRSPLAIAAGGFARSVVNASQ